MVSPLFLRGVNTPWQVFAPRKPLFSIQCRRSFFPSALVLSLLVSVTCRCWPLLSPLPRFHSVPLCSFYVYRQHRHRDHITSSPSSTPDEVGRRHHVFPPVRAVSLLHKPVRRQRPHDELLAAPGIDVVTLRKEASVAWQPGGWALCTSVILRVWPPAAAAAGALNKQVRKRTGDKKKNMMRRLFDLLSICVRLGRAAPLAGKERANSSWDARCFQFCVSTAGRHEQFWGNGPLESHSIECLCAERRGWAELGETRQMSTGEYP